MGLGGEVFHGALHWTISYHLDGGLARPVERTSLSHDGQHWPQGWGAFAL